MAKSGKTATARAKQTKESKAAAAAAREAARVQQSRRERRLVLIGIGVAVVIVAAIVGAVVVSKLNAGPVALPMNVDKATYGYQGGHASSTTPNVALFEDFQCPVCGAFQKAGGPNALENAALAGKLRLSLQPMLIIDTNLGSDSSLRSTAAWGCAIDKGVGLNYHSTVFANQPKEGVGYTDPQLLQFAVASGLTGDTLAAFSDCVTAGTYKDWANKAADYAVSHGVTTTPSVLVNGKALDFDKHRDWLTNPTKLLGAVFAAAKGSPQGSPAPSAS